MAAGRKRYAEGCRRVRAGVRSRLGAVVDLAEAAYLGAVALEEFLGGCSGDEIRDSFSDMEIAAKAIRKALASLD